MHEMDRGRPCWNAGRTVGVVTSGQPGIWRSEKTGDVNWTSGYRKIRSGVYGNV